MSYVTQKETKEIERVTDIICNRCGKSAFKIGIPEHLHFSETWGYGSRRDCERWSGDLCEECAELFEKWLIEAGGHIDKDECDIEGNLVGR